MERLKTGLETNINRELILLSLVTYKINSNPVPVCQTFVENGLNANPTLRKEDVVD